MLRIFFFFLVTFSLCVINVHEKTLTQNGSWSRFCGFLFDYIADWWMSLGSVVTYRIIYIPRIHSSVHFLLFGWVEFLKSQQLVKLVANFRAIRWVVRCCMSDQDMLVYWLLLLLLDKTNERKNLIPGYLSIDLSWYIKCVCVCVRYPPPFSFILITDIYHHFFVWTVFLSSGGCVEYSFFLNQIQWYASVRRSVQSKNLFSILWDFLLLLYYLLR